MSEESEELLWGAQVSIYSNLYAEYIMRNAGEEEAQTGIKIAGKNINNLINADGTTLMGKKWRRTKEPLI